MQYRLTVITILLISGLVICPLPATADDNSDDSIPLFLRQNQAGVRLGGWAHNGSTIPDSIGITVDGQDVGGGIITNLHSASFYIEGFYLYRLSRRLGLEFSGGTISRGSLTIFDTTGRSDVGNLLLYPVTAQIKLYPGRIGGRLYPWVSGGVGLYIGRRAVQFSNAYYNYSNWEEETVVDFTYVLAGGVDWPVASQIGLDLQAKYLPVKFDKSLLTIKDYSAIAVTVGVKYLYGE